MKRKKQEPERNPGPADPRLPAVRSISAGHGFPVCQAPVPPRMERPVQE